MKEYHLTLAMWILLILGVSCIGAGTYLLKTGYQSGELLIGIVGTIAGAIAGMISTRSSASGPAAKAPAAPDDTPEPGAA